MRRWANAFLVNLGSITGVILIWYILSATQIIARVFLPSPVSVWDAIVAGFAHGTLLEGLIATIVAMVGGWFACSVLGIVLGSIIGIWPLARRSLGPVLEIFRPMPPAAVIPVAIAIFGLSREMSLVVIVFGAIWPALLATVHGFSSVEPRLREVSSALNLSPLAFIWKIGLPNAVPDIIAGMRLTMVISLVLVVITGMMTGQLGLGSLVVLASRTFDMAGLFAGLCLLSVVGFGANFALELTERPLLRYKNRT